MAAPRPGDLNRRPVSQSTSQSVSQVSASQSSATPTSVTPIRRRRTRTKRSPASAASSASNHEQVTESVAHPSEAVVHSFARRQPLWVTVLLRLQQGSSLVTLSLIVGAMVVYGWTVYIQQRWGQEYERLETLKKQERQLISANEVLKNQMAEQAESPTAGLLLPNPNNAIFLAPAPQRPAVKPKPPVPPSDSSPNRPLGY